MWNGQEAARCFKKKVLGGYVRALNEMDPQLAGHILKAQRAMFQAGRDFFEVEMGHANRALDKIERKQAGGSPK